MAIDNPSTRPRRWRIVAASSKAWVGCSLVPSPALSTGASMMSATSAGAPLSRWRMTKASGRIALSVRAVSSRVSPFLTELCSTDSAIAEAPSRCAAVANDIAVRVEFS
jgi:hypothetical protein